MTRSRRPRPLIRAASCLLLVAVLGCDGHQFRRLPSTLEYTGDSAALPATWWCDFVLLTGQLNDGPPLTFLLDTGAVHTMIDARVAARFPADLADHRERLTPSDGRSFTSSQRLAIHSFTVGPCTFRNFDAVVLDLTDVADAIGRPLAGILPISLFRGHLLTIDWPAQHVFITRGSLRDAPAGTTYHVRGDPRPFVPLVVNDRTVPCLVDSGASGGLTLQRPLFQHLTFAAPPVPAVATVGAGGKQETFHAGRLADDARLADATLHRPIIFATTGGNRVGVQLLRNFRLTYDYDSRRVRCASATPDPITTPPLRSIGVAFRRAAPPWQVWDILPYSRAAAAGLAIGDQITTVNGTPVGQLDCAALRQLCRDDSVLTIERLGPRAGRLTIPVIDVVP